MINNPPKKFDGNEREPSNALSFASISLPSSRHIVGMQRLNLLNLEAGVIAYNSEASIDQHYWDALQMVSHLTTEVIDLFERGIIVSEDKVSIYSCKTHFSLPMPKSTLDVPQACQACPIYARSQEYCPTKINKLYKEKVELVLPAALTKLPAFKIYRG